MNIYYVYEIQQNGKQFHFRGWFKNHSVNPIGNATPRYDEIKTFTKSWVKHNAPDVHIINNEPDYAACLPFEFLACACGVWREDKKNTIYVFSEVDIYDILKRQCLTTQTTFRRIGCYSMDVKLKNVPSDCDK